MDPKVDIKRTDSAIQPQQPIPKPQGKTDPYTQDDPKYKTENSKKSNSKKSDYLVKKVKEGFEKVKEGAEKVENKIKNLISSNSTQKPKRHSNHESENPTSSKSNDNTTNSALTSIESIPQKIDTGFQSTLSETPETSDFPEVEVENQSDNLNKISSPGQTIGEQPSSQKQDMENGQSHFTKREDSNNPHSPTEGNKSQILTLASENKSIIEDDTTTPHKESLVEAHTTGVANNNTLNNNSEALKNLTKEIEAYLGDDLKSFMAQANHELDFAAWQTWIAKLQEFKVSPPAENEEKYYKIDVSKICTNLFERINAKNQTCETLVRLYEELVKEGENTSQKTNTAPLQQIIQGLCKKIMDTVKESQPNNLSKILDSVCPSIDEPENAKRLRHLNDFFINHKLSPIFPHRSKSQLSVNLSPGFLKRASTSFYQFFVNIVLLFFPLKRAQIARANYAGNQSMAYFMKESFTHPPLFSESHLKAGENCLQKFQTQEVLPSAESFQKRFDNASDEELEQIQENLPTVKAFFSQVKNRIVSSEAATESDRLQIVGTCNNIINAYYINCRNSREQVITKRIGFDIGHLLSHLLTNKDLSELLENHEKFPSLNNDYITKIRSTINLDIAKGIASRDYLFRPDLKDSPAKGIQTLIKQGKDYLSAAERKTLTPLLEDANKLNFLLKLIHERADEASPSDKAPPSPVLSLGSTSANSTQSLTKPELVAA